MTTTSSDDAAPRGGRARARGGADARTTTRCGRGRRTSSDDDRRRRGARRGATSARRARVDRQSSASRAGAGAMDGSGRGRRGRPRRRGRRRLEAAAAREGRRRRAGGWDWWRKSACEACEVLIRERVTSMQGTFRSQGACLARLMGRLRERGEQDASRACAPSREMAKKLLSNAEEREEVLAHRGDVRRGGRRGVVKVCGVCQV